MTGLVEVGRYVRDLRAGLDRLIENALDWEHLPHLHDSSFASIGVIEYGPDGWRADAALADGRPVRIDLRLDAAGWTTRTESAESGKVLAEIRTRAGSLGPDRSRVTVAFLVVDPPPAKEQAIGEGYVRLYERLYDEDERMMMARAEAIRRGPAALKLRRLVTLPNGRKAEAPVYCPHKGLPLDREPDEDGVITCPWHGYWIDLATGRCTPPVTARAQSSSGFTSSSRLTTGSR